jgi:hypothetical protein
VSDVETMRAQAFTDPAAVLDEVTRELAAGQAGTTVDAQRCLAISAEHARAAVLELAKQPVQITIAWPAGVSKDARATLRAQLQGELQRVALMRLRAEFLAVFAIAPFLTRDLAAWVAEVAVREQR